MEQKKKKSNQKYGYSSVFYLPLMILYLEIIFHLAVFGSPVPENVPGVLFILSLGLFLSMIISVFPDRVHYALTWIIQLFFIILFCAEIVYYSVFRQFLALFSMMNVAGQALDFIDVILKNIWLKLPFLLLFLLPIPVFGFYFGQRLNWKRLSLGKMVAVIMACLMFYGAALALLLPGKDALYGGYGVYHQNISTDKTVEMFGVTTMTRLDGTYAIFGAPTKELSFAEIESAETELPVDTTEIEEVIADVIDTSPNIMDIDFESITQNAPNENIVQMTQYFQSKTPTRKNEYTGMFKDYNVIFITAEGFSKYVIDPERTPTLYKLANEGFVFNHYYTPPWYASTSDGEYANLTGLLPTTGRVSMKETGTYGNNMYFTLGRQLERLGYTLNAYHNNSYTYYGRDLSHPNMGYNWHGTGNWFEPETNEYGNQLWPQSDVALITQSVDEYIGQEPFHTYYMSVSGHMLYEWSGNCMAQRNRDAVADLPYSETTKGYLASQLELEKALTLLLEKLETAGIADRTLIVMGADHIPYNDVPVLNELAGHELESEFELYENTLIIWSGSMEEPIVVDKYCYSVDILPTISNLLGLSYDSRLLIGQDILSDCEQLVCFPDRSFISGKCFYNSQTDIAIPFGNETITDEYLSDMKAIVYNKFSISEMILDENYYQYLQ